jgi:estrone sulfotransferase
VELTYVDMLPSPRLLSTHMPFSLFPKPITNCCCRVVYIYREPKDALVSQWHFQNKINREYSIDFEVAITMLCEGFSPCGPFWDHYLEY